MAVSDQQTVIVSGLPRSGTSMMMRMLEAGGLPPLKDDIRKSDVDNPRGYYEYEPVKDIERDSSWLDLARGRAVKMVYRLVYHLPPERRYHVIFMRRDLTEVLASQRAMLARNQIVGQGPSDEEMRKLFEAELSRFEAWAADARHLEILDVDYQQVVSHPREQSERIATFVGHTVNPVSMAEVVDPDLYRQRALEKAVEE